MEWADPYLPAFTAKKECSYDVAYNKRTKEFGEPVHDRIETNTVINKKESLSRNFFGTASQIKHNDLAGEKIKTFLPMYPQTMMQ